MAEYIEREEYCERYCRCSNEYCDKKSCPIWRAPAADVAPVVRCKDCKYLRVYNTKELYAFCPKLNTVFLPFKLDTRTHFCGCGERKETDHDN